MEYQYGDKVIFTDEFGKEQVGTINFVDAFDMQGMLEIVTATSYGAYVRNPGEVRHPGEVRWRGTSSTRLRSTQG